MRVITGMLVLPLAPAASAHSAKEGRGSNAYRADRSASYAKGCYWRRGVRRCSLYCYEEINGKRYCNHRESEAVPQGDPYRLERPTVEEVYRQPRRYR